MSWQKCPSDICKKSHGCSWANRFARDTLCDFFVLRTSFVNSNRQYSSNHTFRLEQIAQTPNAAISVNSASPEPPGKHGTSVWEIGAKRRRDSNPLEAKIIANFKGCFWQGWTWQVGFESFCRYAVFVGEVPERCQEYKPDTSPLSHLTLKHFLIPHQFYKLH